MWLSLNRKSGIIVSYATNSQHHAALLEGEGLVPLPYGKEE